MYNINLVSAWVNEMKANEYNPMHHHTGNTNLGLSSVLILKLPDTFGEEYSRKENPANGLLNLMVMVVECLVIINVKCTPKWAIC